MRRGLLDALERRAEALLDDQAFVVVTFENGQRRTMRLASTIDYLRDGERPRVVDIEGEGGSGDGQLAALLRGLLEGER